MKTRLYSYVPGQVEKWRNQRSSINYSATGAVFHPRYETILVNRLGMVFKRTKSGIIELGGTVLKSGHVSVYVGNGKRDYVHRMVLETFIGPAPSGSRLVRHLDGNPGNNAISNLVWGNDVLNGKDRFKHYAAKVIKTLQKYTSIPKDAINNTLKDLGYNEQF